MGGKEPEGRRPASHARRALEVAASLALLVLIFVGVVPQLASYSDAWVHLSRLGGWWWAAIALTAFVDQVPVVWLYQSALPGLRFRDGFLETETTSAISSTVPAGGAVAVGMTFKMFTSFGFTDLEVSTCVAVTGVWNLTTKFVLPVAAVGLLALTARPPRLAVVAAGVGLAAVVVAGVGLWLVFGSEAGARFVGHKVDRLVDRLFGLLHRPRKASIEQALVQFRTQTVDTARRRGGRLTWATLASQFTVLALVLIIVRAVGIGSGQVGFAAVFTAFAVARLAGALPVTPGGLGTVDAAFIAMLTALGANPSRALAADLVWRMATYLLPVSVGTITYLVWLGRQGRRMAADARLPAKGAAGSRPDEDRLA